MNVAGEPKELLFRTHSNSFIESLEKGADTPVFFVEIHGVAGKDRVGESINRALKFLVNKKVEMIWH